MQLVFEHRDHPEIAAAATDRPEQFLVVLRAGMQEAAVGGYHVRRHQVIDGHAELASQPAEAAAQSQAGHAGRRIDAQRQRQPEGLGFVVYVGEEGAGLGKGAGPGGVDPHRLHRGKIDHHAAFADGGARDVVAAAAHGHRQTVLAREIHRQPHVRDARASQNDRRAAVDHGIPDFAGIVVARRAGNQDLAPCGCLEGIQRFIG
ncbi:hypothetical protein FQZ97_903910 [compost metagenome]